MIASVMLYKERPSALPYSTPALLIIRNCTNHKTNHTSSKHIAVCM